MGNCIAPAHPPAPMNKVKPIETEGGGSEEEVAFMYREATLLNGQRPTLYNPGNFDTYYHLDRFIDQGAFAQVHRCSKKPPFDNEKYAVKIIDKSRYKPQYQYRFLKEIEIMSKLEHPNIIQIHEYFDVGMTLFIVMELCRGKDLFYEINERRERYYKVKRKLKPEHFDKFIKGKYLDENERKYVEKYKFSPDVSLYTWRTGEVARIAH